MGFQSLIQKEWISLGHPFCSRLGLIADTEMEQVHLQINYMMPNVLLNCDVLPQSPMFLLFLDCVWQLTNQFPDKFEFTETYLTTLWDSCHIGVFDNFLFNSERDRRNAEMVNHRVVFFLLMVLIKIFVCAFKYLVTNWSLKIVRN